MPTVNHKESASSSQVVPELSQGSAKPVKKLSQNTAQETPPKVAKYCPNCAYEVPLELPKLSQRSAQVA